MPVPICGRFCLHSVDVARYAALIQAKSPTNCTHILQKAFFKHALVQHLFSFYILSVCFSLSPGPNPSLSYSAFATSHGRTSTGSLR
ncbi:DUF6783 domain-containing protein [Anaerobutyricum hallii]|uniref:DUF6783 domain-containing protein n=1 Tax=Anaerobutyricum hallii TaxID=39488 RepID=UPI003A8723C7